MNASFERLRAILTQEEWDNFLINIKIPMSYFYDANPNEIITASFSWSHTPQGFSYWKDIHTRIINNNTIQVSTQPTPEPPRLPDYKPGQWIAVWSEQGLPTVRKFSRFEGSIIFCTLPDRSDAVAWSNHCTLEELPEVLAKRGEKK